MIYSSSLVAVCFLIATNGKDVAYYKPATFADTIKPFKKEIPTHRGGVDIFYKLAKGKEKQLGLDSIENGYDSLQIRFWYDYSLFIERGLIIIANDGFNWTATVYDLEVDWDGYTETIVSRKVRRVTPKSGWDNFSKKLLDLEVLVLPDQDSIPNYRRGNDGIGYHVEVATKSYYRFYGYWWPQHFQDKFWQARNMTAIIRLLDEELRRE